MESTAFSLFKTKRSISKSNNTKTNSNNNNKSYLTPKHIYLPSSSTSPALSTGSFSSSSSSSSSSYLLLKSSKCATSPVDKSEPQAQSSSVSTGLKSAIPNVSSTELVKTDVVLNSLSISTPLKHLSPTSISKLICTATSLSGSTLFQRSNSNNISNVLKPTSSASSKQSETYSQVSEESLAVEAVASQSFSLINYSFSANTFNISNYESNCIHKLNNNNNYNNKTNISKPSLSNINNVDYEDSILKSNLNLSSLLSTVDVSSEKSKKSKEKEASSSLSLINLQTKLLSSLSSSQPTPAAVYEKAEINNSSTITTSNSSTINENNKNNNLNKQKLNEKYSSISTDNNNKKHSSSTLSTLLHYNTNIYNQSVSIERQNLFSNQHQHKNRFINSSYHYNTTDTTTPTPSPTSTPTPNRFSPSNYQCSTHDQQSNSSTIISSTSNTADLCSKVNLNKSSTINSNSNKYTTTTAAKNTMTSNDTSPVNTNNETTSVSDELTEAIVNSIASSDTALANTDRADDQSIKSPNEIEIQKLLQQQPASSSPSSLYSSSSSSTSSMSPQANTNTTQTLSSSSDSSSIANMNQLNSPMSSPPPIKEATTTTATVIATAVPTEQLSVAPAVQENNTLHPVQPAVVNKVSYSRFKICKLKETEIHDIPRPLSAIGQQKEPTTPATNTSNINNNNNNNNNTNNNNNGININNNNNETTNNTNNIVNLNALSSEENKQTISNSEQSSNSMLIQTPILAEASSSTSSTFKTDNLNEIKISKFTVKKVVENTSLTISENNSMTNNSSQLSSNGNVQQDSNQTGLSETKKDQDKYNKDQTDDSNDAATLTTNEIKSELERNSNPIESTSHHPSQLQQQSNLQSNQQTPPHDSQQQQQLQMQLKQVQIQLQQQMSLNQSQMPLQVQQLQQSSTNVTRTNSMSEKNDADEKEQELLEEEKSVDESPDHRFLKYDKDIGRGSFKTVYKGLDTESGVQVAWCELHDRKFNKAERQRFIEEAEMLKKLQHPNIVRFYDYWEDSKTKPKRIILVTELMTSGTLKAYVQRFKKQEKTKRFKVIKNFANQILKGLAYLHGRQPPVIHRDLKCDNVFVTGQCGQVKIGDLGLATLKKTSFAKSVIGTPEFMAPEMYSEQYDESIDVYAFGMCLLEMATGEYPYQECTKPFEIYKRVTSGIRPENYSRIDDDDLRELIDLCIRQKKSQRPTVKDLVNHSWFMENNGLKLEIHKDEKTKKIFWSFDAQVLFRLKLIDKSKHKNWPENEAIEFIFDVDKDNPESIVKELKDNMNKINEEDLRYLVQAIKDKCLVFKLEREDRLDEENKENNQANNSVSSNQNTPLTSSNANTAQQANTNATVLTSLASINTVVTNQTNTVGSVSHANNSEILNVVQSAPSINNNNNITQQQQQAAININKSNTDLSNSSISQQQQQQQQSIYINETSKPANIIINQQTTIKQTENSVEIDNQMSNQPQIISQQQQQHQQPQQQQQQQIFINPIVASNQLNQQQQQQQQQQLLQSNLEQQQYYQQPVVQQNMQKSIIQDEIVSLSSSPLTIMENNLDAIKSSNKPKQANKETPLKLTIKEVHEGDIVNCVLEVDGKQTVNFQFGLNNSQDNPLDITNQLLNAIKNENHGNLGDSILSLTQQLIHYLNNKRQNQQFDLNSISKVFSNEILESLADPIQSVQLPSNNISNNNSILNLNLNQHPIANSNNSNNNISSNVHQQPSIKTQPAQQIQPQPLNQTPVQLQTQTQPQVKPAHQHINSTTSTAANASATASIQQINANLIQQQFQKMQIISPQQQQQQPSGQQQVPSNLILKNLQEKQQSLSNEIQQVTQRIELNSSNLASYTSNPPKQFLQTANTNIYSQSSSQQQPSQTAYIQQVHSSNQFISNKVNNTTNVVQANNSTANFQTNQNYSNSMFIPNYPNNNSSPFYNQFSQTQPPQSHSNYMSQNQQSQSMHANHHQSAPQHSQSMLSHHKPSQVNLVQHQSKQGYPAHHLLQNRSISIQDCHDQHDFDTQLLNNSHPSSSSTVIQGSFNNNQIYQNYNSMYSKQQATQHQQQQIVQNQYQQDFNYPQNSASSFSINSQQQQPPTPQQIQSTSSKTITSPTHMSSNNINKQPSFNIASQNPIVSYSNQQQQQQFQQASQLPIQSSQAQLLKQSHEIIETSLTTANQHQYNEPYMSANDNPINMIDTFSNSGAGSIQAKPTYASVTATNNPSLYSSSPSTAHSGESLIQQQHQHQKNQLSRKKSLANLNNQIDSSSSALANNVTIIESSVIDQADNSVNLDDSQPNGMSQQTPSGLMNVNQIKQVNHHGNLAELDQCLKNVLSSTTTSKAGPKLNEQTSNLTPQQHLQQQPQQQLPGMYLPQTQLLNNSISFNNEQILSQDFINFNLNNQMQQQQPHQMYYNQQLQYHQQSQAQPQQQQQQLQQQQQGEISIQSSYPSSYPISRRNSSDRLVNNNNNNNNNNMMASDILVNQPKNNSQFIPNNSNNWLSNNVTAPGSGDQLDSHSSNMNTESIMNKLTHTNGNELAHTNGNDSTLCGPGSGSSSVSVINDSLNSTLMNTIGQFSSIPNDKHYQVIDNLADKLFMLGDTLLINPNQFIDIITRHQRERDDLQKRHQNELIQLLLSQSKYSYSNMNTNNDHLSNKDQ